MTTALNTLFITVDGTRLNKEGERVVVTIQDEKKAEVPLRHLRSVVCLARAWMTPELLESCVEAGIHVSFFGMTGRFLARVEGLPGGNVLLRRTQFRAADDGARTLAIARAMVVGKLGNARQFLLHARRDAAEERKGALEEAARRLSGHLRAVERAEDLEQVRGLEGIAARDYFEAFPDLLKGDARRFVFDGRNRRPPRDPLNALLSFGYALLAQDCAGALAGVGLDPAVGFLHEDRPGRLSLALDLMEELRAPVVDRLVFSLVNRGQLKPEDFKTEAAGAVMLKDDARKTFLVAYQGAKQVEVQHVFLGQQTSWGLVPHLQALLLARALRGELDGYPPFAVR
ncbi:type I-C CRISPR-associated endonuclease Cas1c [Myxococcus qinghaiensis]|uniref:type I-C CRISPR-associated endonuclease Cas1c n=1 Tax=Myxococcus qinghaiensis TaxID=2906758 RepID=UPI0020A6FB25|nr:type I-C CRISPR-associated endonuclease Cas1c [Myxococcus qinghaiensis]MCP3168991.1 type I-C CRISPR-associated endonuclease Cas1c [Myxococcus qinghaiensis]